MCLIEANVQAYVVCFFVCFFSPAGLRVHICRLSRCEWGSGRPGDLFRGDYICH